LGLAPVPTLVSVICKPDAVVMGFPALCAVAVDGAPPAMPIAAAAAMAKANILKRCDMPMPVSLGSLAVHM
jgi:hypothetical protein